MTCMFVWVDGRLEIIHGVYKQICSRCSAHQVEDGYHMVVGMMFPYRFTPALSVFVCRLWWLEGA